MSRTVAPAFVTLLLAFTAVFAHGAEIAEADAARKTPLQRCDQLSDKAEIECLQKARERILDARRKREAAGKGNGNTNAGRGDAALAPAKK